MNDVAGYVSRLHCELRSFRFRSSLGSKFLAALGSAAIVLASGCSGGPQADPTPDPKDPIPVARIWTFDKFTTGANETEPIGAPRSQIGGVVNDKVELGSLPLAPPGLDLHARLEAFSNESGSTYWVASQAPAGPPVEKATTLGGDVDLVQYQFFRKQDQSASFRAVVNRVILEAFDQDLNPPTFQECQWRGRPGSGDCLDVMETDVQLSYFVCAISSAGEFRCSIYNSAVVARLQGWHHHWNFTTGHGDSSDCAVIHPCVDFQNPHFFFDPDDDDDGGSHAVAELEQPITLNIPLDGVSQGQLFVVNVEVTSSSFNHRQGETYIGSFLRDPADQAGLTFEIHGIEPVQTNLPRPPRPIIQPAPACSGASDPAAGTIQFAEANYFKAEVPGQGAYISITRAGGTKGDVSVLLTTADGTAQAGKDYEAFSKVIRFGDGDNIVQLIPVKS
jgi:Calx-beta domain